MDPPKIIEQEKSKELEVQYHFSDQNYSKSIADGGLMARRPSGIGGGIAAIKKHNFAKSAVLKNTETKVKVEESPKNKVSLIQRIGGGIRKKEIQKVEKKVE